MSTIGEDDVDIADDDADLTTAGAAVPYAAVSTSTQTITIRSVLAVAVLLVQRAWLRSRSGRTRSRRQWHIESRTMRCGDVCAWCCGHKRTKGTPSP
jgi:hypothetical protein